MINNITTMDLRPQLSVAKASTSLSSMSMPPILGFKTPQLKEKANIRIKKIKRSDNIIIPGVIDEDDVDIVEEDSPNDSGVQSPIVNSSGGNFFAPSFSPTPSTQKRKLKYLKNCYIIEYIIFM